MEWTCNPVTSTQMAQTSFQWYRTLIDRDNIQQQCDQIVDIAKWPVYQEFDVFPEGARNKSLRVCPKVKPFDFCIPDHKYLFKETIKSAKDARQPRHPDQY